jgi:hypothetical protein
MKITQRQLRQIIKEELMSEMPVGISMMMRHKKTSVPPDLRLAETMDMSCGTCAAFCPKTQTCKAFGGYAVSADMVCSAWQPKS